MFFVVQSYLYPPDVQLYAAAERLDPIFALEGTDPEKLRSAVTSFLQSRDEFASYLDKKAAANVKNSLYPEDFLKLLPDLEQARQTLQKDPTVKTAAAYHTLLLKTIQAYETGAQKLAAMLRGPAQLQGLMNFSGGVSSTASVALQIEAVIHDAQEQATKENTRYSCMRHPLESQCESLATLSAARSAALNQPVPTLAAPSASLSATDAMVKEIIQFSYPRLTDISPLIAVQSDCFIYPTTYVRPWQFPGVGGGEAFKTYVANDAFFYDVKKFAANLDTSALYKAALKQGARYEYQNIANYYMCPDSGFYVSDISRIMGVRELAQQTATTEASQLLSLSFLQKQDALGYVKSAGSDEAVDRYIQGSSDFDQTLETLANDNVYLLAVAKSGGTVGLPYLYVARSYASILFFLGNPTFVAQHISFFSPGAKTLQDPTLLSWRDSLSATTSVDQMLVEAKKSVEIFRVINGR